MNGTNAGRGLGRAVARGGLGTWLVLAAACGDDGAGDPTAGSSVGMTTLGESTGPDATGSGSGASTGGTSGTSSAGSTSAVDGTSSGDSGGEETAIPEVFFPEVLAVIQAECFCHQNMMFMGQLDMRDDMAYASLVSVPAAQAPGVDRVSPGDPDNSYLYLKLLGEQASVGGGGTRMPQLSPMLPPEQIDLVRYWILGGAQP